MTGAWLLLTSLALAGTPVLVQQADGVDVSEIVARAQPGQDEQLEVLIWPELAATAAPTLTGDATLVPCTAAPTTTLQLGDAVEAATRSLRFMQPDAVSAALQGLQDGVDDLQCLAERPAHEQLVALHYLQGVLHAALGQESAASQAFVAALVLSPELEWDRALSHDAGASLFEAARAQRARQARARLLLEPADLPRWVDGQPVGAESTLPAGAHLLQWGTGPLRSAWLTVQPGASVAVVLPSSGLPLSAVEDPLRQDALSRQLDAALDSAGPVLVIVEDRLWRRSRPGAPWQRVKRTKVQQRLPLVVGTAAVAAAGAGIATWSGVQISSATAACEAARGVAPEECGAQQQAFEAASTRLTWSSVVGAVGLVGLGLTVSLDGPAVLWPRPLQGPGGWP